METANSSKAALPLHPVRRTSIVESVREQIVALMEQRSLRPGDILPAERELTSILGVGRSSLREALSGLVAMGVLAAGGRKGYRVQSLAAPELALPEGLRASQIAELFEARRILEAGIAELACERATEDDFAALEECLESIRRAQRARRSTAPAAGRFHMLLARATRNGFLETQLQALYNLMVQVGTMTERGTGSKFADEQYDSHKALLDAVRSRTPSLASEAMRAHVDRFAGEAGESTTTVKDPLATDNGIDA